MTLVVVRGLSGGYGGAPVVSGLDFGVEAGQTVAVLGPNGGGKTSLFLALLGALPARSGEVRVDGTLAHLAQHDHARTDVPLSALDVALLGDLRTPWWRRRDRAPARAALERLGLGDAVDTAYGALSGGQRRRVALARVLLEDARVLLLDEPMSGVDAVSAARIEATLDQLAAEGRAVLIATHDIRAARRASRVLCLHGEQIAFGPPDEVLTTEVLARTYGEELVVLEDGALAVAVDHHDHAH